MFKDVMLDGIEVKYMYTELVENRKIFKRLIDAFMVAAIVGYIKCEYSNKEVKDENNRRRIPQSAFINNIEQYGIIINIIALLHFNKMDEDDILFKIFSDSAENWNEKLDIVTGYANGGIKILYDEIVGENSTNIDDSIEKIYNLINDFPKKFKLVDDMESEPFGDIVENLL